MIEPNPINFNDLPNELLLVIADNVESGQDLLSFACTCEEMYETVQGILDRENRRSRLTALIRRLHDDKQTELPDDIYPLCDQLLTTKSCSSAEIFSVINKIKRFLKTRNNVLFLLSVGDYEVDSELKTMEDYQRLYERLVQTSCDKKLRKITNLDLSRLGLTGIPEELERYCPKLERLAIYHNYIPKLPPDLFQRFPKLTGLHMDREICTNADKLFEEHPKFTELMLYFARQTNEMPELFERSDDGLPKPNAKPKGCCTIS